MCRTHTFSNSYFSPSSLPAGREANIPKKRTSSPCKCPDLPHSTFGQAQPPAETPGAGAQDRSPVPVPPLPFPPAHPAVPGFPGAALGMSAGSPPAAGAAGKERRRRGTPALTVPHKSRPRPAGPGTALSPSTPPRAAGWSSSAAAEAARRRGAAGNGAAPGGCCCPSAWLWSCRPPARGCRRRPLPATASTRG